MKDFLSISDTVSVITGGGSGLGYATAQVFTEYGANVVIVGRNEQRLKSASERLGEKCCYYICDLCDLQAVPILVDKIISKHGKIDTLVNNAGRHLKKHCLDVSDSEFAQIIQVNQLATFSLTREVAKHMRQEGTGAIIMVSSMAAHYGIPGVIAYTASKSAVEGMTMALASELSPHGIRVNCVAPGFMQTPMLVKALAGDPERKKKILGRTPISEFGEPADVGNAIAFLSSEAAKFITGTVLRVDGGNAIGF